MLQQMTSVEVQVLAAVAVPLMTALVAWLVRQLQLHLRDARQRAYVGRLVAWAQQVIPDKSERYVQVAGLLSRRYPGLRSSDLEVLIESAVLALKAGLAAAPVAVPAAAAVAAPASALPPGPVPTPVAAPLPTAAPAPEGAPVGAAVDIAARPVSGAAGVSASGAAGVSAGPASGAMAAGVEVTNPSAPAIASAMPPVMTLQAGGGQ